MDGRPPGPLSDHPISSSHHYSSAEHGPKSSKMPSDHTVRGHRRPWDRFRVSRTPLAIREQTEGLLTSK